ncbi:MAG: hypothetical protein ACK4WH_10405 [Phycisphaerales bacterium]
MPSRGYPRAGDRPKCPFLALSPSAALLALFTSAVAATAPTDLRLHSVFLAMHDGSRWTEVFTRADEAIINDKARRRRRSTEA